MEQVGLRKGEMTNMELDGKGRMRIEATVPARGLIGFRSEFLTLTSGSGIMTSSFSHYGPQKSVMWVVVQTAYWFLWQTVLA